MKKLLASAAVTAALGLVAAPASAIVVSGIDFGALGSAGFHIETATIAEQFINPVTDPVNGSGQGYGVINTVNGDSSYCATGCKIFYIVDFGGGTFTSPTKIEFATTTIRMFTGAEFNLLNQDSPTNLASIASLTPLASFTGHANIGGNATLATSTNVSEGQLTGGTLNFIGRGLLDVNTGDAFGDASFESFLDANNVLDAAGGFADVVYSETAGNTTLNPFDVINGLAIGCKDGSAATGAWCFAGSLEAQGSTVIPEPGTVGLLSLGLMAGGLVARSRRSKLRAG